MLDTKVSFARLDALLDDFAKAAGLPAGPDSRPSSKQFADSARKLRDYGDDRQRQLEQIRQERLQLRADLDAGRMQPFDVMQTETRLNHREGALLAKVAPIVGLAARAAAGAAGAAAGGGSADRTIR